MDTEKTVSDAPPARSSPVVIARLRNAERELAGLKQQIPERGLAAAEGKPGARQAMAALRVKIDDLKFEIESNRLAHELAQSQDAAAFAAWRVALQQMAPEQIIEGINREQCSHRCLRGIPGGCVLAGGDAFGSSCYHPIIEKNLFTRDSSGKRTFSLSHNPRAAAVFNAALNKLKVRGEYA